VVHFALEVSERASFTHYGRTSRSVRKTISANALNGHLLPRTNPPCNLAFVTMLRSVFALLLLAIWPAVTSHALMERFELIHEVHYDHEQHSNGGSHEHSADDHDFADGGYFAKTSGNSAPLRVDLWSYQAASLTVFLFWADSIALKGFGPAPPGVAPPEYLHSWQFLHRTSADVRAPSSLL
jgi:hypothetical protein